MSNYWLLENYGIYKELIEKGSMTIDVRTINRSNYEMHYNSILNIMLDGIETEFMKHTFISVKFDETNECELSIPDYWFNIIMWYCIIVTEKPIRPYHLFFDDAITRKSIKKYIDEFFLEENITKLDAITLNNVIDDCLSRYARIDDFSMFLANTINLEDFIELMNIYPEAFDIIHCDLENVPLDDVKKVGMQKTERLIEIIKQSKFHCLANFFQAQEGVNIKQFKEVAVNMGTKPDGNGGIFPVVVNTNLLTGGLNDLGSYIIETSVGRIAQIIVENNVGVSGHFARLLGLNNTDSYIHPDPHYTCNTKNFIKLYIKDENMLSRLDKRYYRLNPNGIDFLISSRRDKHLIGQTIYLRSPMTCSSAAHGHGICYKCYGDLAYLNKDINIGKMAAELLSSVLTQMMLSAKHLLESAVKKMVWNNEFKDLFDVEFNVLILKEELNLNGFKMIINPNSIECTNEDDEGLEYNEYITSFQIMYPDGTLVPFSTTELDEMYLTIEINEYIREHAKTQDELLYLDLEHLRSQELPLFIMQLHNNDLSKTLDKIKKTIDNKDITCKLNKDELLNELLCSLMDGNLKLNSVHAEIILSNQIRNKTDILQTPNWEYPNEEYDILTLKQSLTNHPSVTVSLEYERVCKQLYNPLTFRKNKPSFMDLFFMEQPQLYLANKEIIQQSPTINDEDSSPRLKPSLIKKKDEEEIIEDMD